MLLNVHSYYSLRYGTINIDDLVSTLVARGHHTAVLTDINNSSGVFPFIRKCREAGINGLVGMEFLNHERSNWGNNAPRVSVQDVEQIVQKIKKMPVQ